MRRIVDQNRFMASLNFSKSRGFDVHALDSRQSEETENNEISSGNSIRHETAKLREMTLSGK